MGLEQVELREMSSKGAPSRPQEQPHLGGEKAPSTQTVPGPGGWCGHWPHMLCPCPRWGLHWVLPGPTGKPWAGGGQSRRCSLSLGCPWGPLS